MHGVDKVDLIWFTCCALHNWLLDIDGLSDEWTGEHTATAMESDWLGDLGDHDFDGITVGRERIPNAILRLSNNLTNRNFDATGMGPGPDVVDESNEVVDSEVQSDMGYDEDGETPARVVNKLPLRFFRSKLVEHFHILWTRNKIVWPTARPPIAET